MSLNNEISRESQTRTENIELISQCLEVIYSNKYI